MRNPAIILIAAVSATLASTVTYAATRELPWTNNIYNVSGAENDATLSVIDDGDNKCYIARSRSGMNAADLVAISCVKR